MPGAALRAVSVSARYDRVTALDAVSLEVGDGECVALVGESGAGKSTVLRVALGLTPIAAGTIETLGDDVARVDPVALRRRVGYVPQDGGLLPHWTVAANAGLVPWLTGDPDYEARGRAALATVGLPPDAFGARWPGTLSGGQRQRVAFARALAFAPRLVLLDEPFGALDALTRSDLQAMFETLRRDTAVAALLVTHDLQEACRLADRVAVMRAGRLEQVAAPGDLVRAPATPYVAALLARARLGERPA